MRRLSLAFAVPLLPLMVAYDLLWAVGTPTRTLLPLGIAFFGLAALWGVAALGRQVALQYAKPHDRHGPDADYHDPGTPA